jgi:hypothetical protein
MTRVANMPFAKIGPVNLPTDTDPQRKSLWSPCSSPERPAHKAAMGFVPTAQVHVLDAGHFALDTAADEIAGLIRSFIDTSR